MRFGLSFVISLKFVLRSLRLFLPFYQIILLLSKYSYDLNLGFFLALEGRKEMQGIIVIVNIIITIVNTITFLGLFTITLSFV